MALQVHWKGENNMSRKPIKNDWANLYEPTYTNFNNIEDNLLYILDEDATFKGNKTFGGLLDIATSTLGSRFLIDVDNVTTDGDVIHKATLNNVGSHLFRVVNTGVNLDVMSIENDQTVLFNRDNNSRYAIDVATGTDGDVIHKATLNNVGSHLFRVVNTGVNLDVMSIRNDQTVLFNRDNNSRFMIDVASGTDGEVIHKSTLNNSGKHIFRVVNSGANKDALVIDNDSQVNSNGIFNVNTTSGGSRFFIDADTETSTGEVVFKTLFNNIGFYTFQTVVSGVATDRFQILNNGNATFYNDLTVTEDLNVTGNINPTTTPTESNHSLSVSHTTWDIPRGTYSAYMTMTGTASGSNILYLEEYISGVWVEVDHVHSDGEGLENSKIIPVISTGLNLGTRIRLVVMGGTGTIFLKKY